MSEFSLLGSVTKDLLSYHVKRKIQTIMQFVGDLLLLPTHFLVQRK